MQLTKVIKNNTDMFFEKVHNETLKYQTTIWMKDLKGLNKTTLLARKETKMSHNLFH